MKPVQLPLGVRLRDDATFANYYPVATAAPHGYVERLCDADAGWTEKLTCRWGITGDGGSHLLEAVGLCFEQLGEAALYLPLDEVAWLGPELLDKLDQYGGVCLDDL